ncbi:hypothetical protein BH09PAT1_BH09PAT1_6330 [soil metagenome]
MAKRGETIEMAEEVDLADEISSGSRTQFNSDLKEGQEIEKKLQKSLEVMDIVDSVITGNTYEWDLKVNLPNVHILIEVKNDKKFSETGNLGIEFKCRGNPSGIDTTNATLWFHHYDGKFRFIKVPDLKKLIEDKAYFHIVTKGGYKDSFTHMYLFRKSVFEKYTKLFEPENFNERLVKVNEQFA